MNGDGFIVLINDLCEFFDDCFSWNFIIFIIKIVMWEVVGGKILCIVNKFVFYYVVVFI